LAGSGGISVVVWAGAAIGGLEVVGVGDGGGVKTTAVVGDG
jgi:hypothetical protein